VPGATETSNFAAAGQKPFMTRGRQSPQQVVATALAATSTTAPTIVSGRMNRLTVTGIRSVPRRIAPVIARQMVR
jgi:uncharacterized protein